MLRFGGIKRYLAPFTSKEKIVPSSCGYEPLHAGEVRILTLHSGPPSSTIRCSLSPRSLEDDRLRYVALSWTWGPNALATKDIVVNDNLHAVRPVVYEALSALRRPDTDLLIWIDALCINQQDVLEKAVQVPLMTQIYTQAVEVVVWLGSAADDSDVFFDYFGTPSDERKGDTPADDQRKAILSVQGSHFMTWALWALGKNASDLQHARERLNTVDYRVMASILRLQNRSWFSRVWIIQELALNKRDPTIRCGGKQMTWSSLVSAVGTILEDKAIFAPMAKIVEAILGAGTTKQAPNGPTENEPRLIDAVLLLLDFVNNIRFFYSMDPSQVISMRTWDLDKARTAFHDTKDIRLSDAIEQLTFSKSTDPRDRVYGVLGLLSKSSRDEFISCFGIDYTKSVAEVFTDAMVFIFRTEGGRGFRLFEQFEVGIASAHFSLPSWVLDFTTRASNMNKSLKLAVGEDYAFSTLTTVSEDRTTLSVKGHSLGTVVTCVPLGHSAATLAAQKPPSSSSRMLTAIWRKLNELPATLLLMIVLGSWSSAAEAARRSFNHQRLSMIFIRQLTAADRSLQSTAPNSASNLLWDLVANVYDAFGSDRVDGYETYKLITSLGNRFLFEYLYPIQMTKIVTDTFFANITVLLGDLSLFICDNGYYGFASGHITNGDALAMLSEQQYLPFIVRSGGDNCELVGMAYLMPSARDEILAAKQGAEGVQFRII